MTTYDNDAANVRVWDDGGVFVAAVGSTAPTTPTAQPDVDDWTYCGWNGTDGITEKRDSTGDQKRAWQRGATVRVVRAFDGRTFKFQCLETTALTLGLSRPGSTPSTASGVTHTSVKGYTGSDVRAWIFDKVDTGAGIHDRSIVKRGEILDGPEIVYKGDDLSILEYTVVAEEDSSGAFYEHYSDDPALAVA